METADVKQDKGTKAAARNCEVCGAVKQIEARGLCAACYHRERRRRIKAKVGALSQAGVAQGLVLRVDFSALPHLLEGLRQRAAKDLRSIQNQLLWELFLGVTAGLHQEKSAGEAR